MDGVRDTYIYVRNRGPNNAKYVTFDAVFVLWRGKNKVPPGDEGIAPKGGHGIAVIERGKTATYPPSAIRKPVQVDWGQIGAKSMNLMVIGRIAYQDDMDVLRNTGFGWTYDTDQGQFIRPEKEDEYNYED